MTRHAELIELDEVLSDPTWFLSGLDARRREFVFVHSSRALLSQAAFLDGRSPITASNRTIRVGIDRAVAWAQAANVRQCETRYILHVAFCGSTLLARLLDQEGICLAYKEPQVLIDAAAYREGLLRTGPHRQSWSDLLRVINAQLSKTFSTDECSVIKPSNWPLALFDSLCEPDRARIVFMTSHGEDFLIAVLRGGQERIRFILKFLLHLRPDYPGVAQAISEVETAKLPPIARALRFALIALRAQERELDRIRSRFCDDRYARICYRDLVRDPGGTTARAAKALSVDWSEACCEGLQNATLSRYSKDLGVEFDPACQRQEDERLKEQYGAEICDALNWADRRLGPSPLLAYTDS